MFGDKLFEQFKSTAVIWDDWLPMVGCNRTMTTITDVSERANKVYDAMKKAGFTNEQKMGTAETVTKVSHPLAKNIVLNCLQELESKGYVKRKAREKSAGYYLIK